MSRTECSQLNAYRCRRGLCKGLGDHRESLPCPSWLPADRVVTPALLPGLRLPGPREGLPLSPLQLRGWGSASPRVSCPPSGVFTGQTCPLAIRCSMPCARPSRASWDGGDTCPAQPLFGPLTVSSPVLHTYPCIPATPSTCSRQTASDLPVAVLSHLTFPSPRPCTVSLSHALDPPFPCGCFLGVVSFWGDSCVPRPHEQWTWFCVG